MIGKSASGRSYAKGRRAIAECQRSGQKMKYRDLVEDGHVAGLLVHPAWWEPKHPQEIPVEVDDPVALYRPAPEISIPVGYGDPENADGGTTPTAPDGGAVVTGTLSEALSGAETHLVSTNALKFNMGQWVFMELDGGGVYFVSRTVTECDFPAFSIPFTSPFVGAAAIGNNFYVTTTGDPFDGTP